MRLRAAALAELSYYSFFSDRIQELCSRSNVLPCVLDAAIFSPASVRAACSLGRSLELVLVVGAARCEQLLGTARGLVDIFLEIILKEGVGPDKPGKVLL